MFSDLLERIPHRPPMRLITSVDSVEGKRIVCGAALGGNPLFAGMKEIPAFFCLELVAQAGAVLLAAMEGGSAAGGGGRLVSARQFDLLVGTASAEPSWQVEAELLNDPGDAMVLIRGEVRDGNGVALARGQVAVYRENV